MSSDGLGKTDHTIDCSSDTNVIEETNNVPDAPTLLPHGQQESVEVSDFIPKTAVNMPEKVEENLEIKETQTCSTSTHSQSISVQTKEGLEAPVPLVTPTTYSNEQETDIMRSTSQDSQQNKLSRQQKEYCDDNKPCEVVSLSDFAKSAIGSPKVETPVPPIASTPESEQTTDNDNNDKVPTSEKNSCNKNTTEHLDETSDKDNKNTVPTPDKDGVPTIEIDTRPDNANAVEESPKEQKTPKKLSPSVAPFKPQSLEVNRSYPTSALSLQHVQQQLTPSPYPSVTDTPMSPPVYPIFAIPLVRCCYDSQHYNSMKGGVQPSRRRTCDRGARCYHRHVIPRLGEGGGEGPIVEAIELFAHLYAPSIKAFYDSVLANAQQSSKQNLTILTFSKLRHDELPCQYGHSCKNELHRQAAEKLQYGDASKRIYDDFSREMRAYEYRVIQQRHHENKLKQHCQLTGAKPWPEPAPQYNFPNYNNALHQQFNPSALGPQLQTPFLGQNQNFFNSPPPMMPFPGAPQNPYAQQYPYSMLTNPTGVDPASQLNMLALAASGLGAGLPGQPNSLPFYNYMLQAQNQQQQQQFGQQPLPQQFADPFNTNANPSLYPNLGNPTFQQNTNVQQDLNTLQPLLSDSSVRSNVENEQDMTAISSRLNIGGTQMTRPQSIPQPVFPTYNTYM